MIENDILWLQLNLLSCKNSNFSFEVVDGLINKISKYALQTENGWSR